MVVAPGATAATDFGESSGMKPPPRNRLAPPDVRPLRNTTRMVSLTCGRRAGCGNQQPDSGQLRQTDSQLMAAANRRTAALPPSGS